MIKLPKIKKGYEVIIKIRPCFSLLPTNFDKGQLTKELAKDYDLVLFISKRQAKRYIKEKLTDIYYEKTLKDGYDIKFLNITASLKKVYFVDEEWLVA